MQVSDFPAILKADFGLFRPFSGLYRPPADMADMANTARFWPNQPDSARIEANSARIEPHQRESEKKKPRRSPTRGQPRRTPRPASDAGAAPLVPRPCILDSPTMTSPYLRILPPLTTYSQNEKEYDLFDDFHSPKG